MAARDLDSTTDLGVPLGLRKTSGRCNYQWAIEGPDGYVIFYCTNSASCNGNPHKVWLNSATDSATDTVKVEWANEDDVARRAAAPKLAPVLPPEEER